MARTLLMGFETGRPQTDQSNTNWGTTNGVTSDTSIVRTGTYSLKVVAASATNCSLSFGYAAPDDWMRVYVRVTARPATTARALIGASGSVLVKLNANGTLSYTNPAGSLIGTSTTALTDTARWYMVEVTGATGTSVPVLKIDGNTEVTGSPSAWNLITLLGANDSVADTYTAYFDDLSRDSAGFPGSGKLVLLAPTSLSAGGSWTNGAGSTPVTTAGVATYPPPGLASASETNTSNIESATNSATDNCDFNCTTYAAAGIVAADTITAVAPVARTGEDIATGTKLFGLLIVSNPATGEEQFNVGSDFGAHGSDQAAGSLWCTNYGTPVGSPSVTLGTAPVLRIGKRTATTRVICVDFLGIYVEYIPGTTARVPRSPGVDSGFGHF